MKIFHELGAGSPLLQWLLSYWDDPNMTKGPGLRLVHDDMQISLILTEEDMLIRQLISQS